MSGIAFFDVDKTILAVNSARLWVRREFQTGRLSLKDAARAAWWTGLYELGFARIETVIEDAVRTLKGQKESDLVERVEIFYDEEVHRTIRNGARDAVHRHRQAGDHIALLTSSSLYLAKKIGTAIEADYNLANEFEVDNQGVFTGTPVLPLCYGPGKLIHARRLAEKLTIPLQDCHFYTDSFSDLPVMEHVGFPVAVHPDPRLKRVALRRGWPIEKWRS